MKLWQIAIPIAALVTFGAVIGFNAYKEKLTQEYLANRKAPVSPVVTTIAKKAPLQESLSAIGFIEPNQGIDVVSEVSGSITGLFFDSGNLVKAGDVLVQVNDTVETANLEAALAKIEAAKKKYVRYSALIQKGNVSQQDLDNAKADYESSVADADSIKAKLDKLKIRVPFDGKVGIRNVYKGQYLQPGSKIVHLEDNSLVKVRFTVPQNEVDRIKIGETVNISVDAYPGQVFEGKITAIEVVMNYESGLLQVQGTIPNPANKLITGMYAKVDVILPNDEPQIAVPKTAVAFNLYGTSLYRVKTDKDGQKIAEQVTVETGSENASKIVITKGINEGDEIITEGQIRISNGSPVTTSSTNVLTQPEKLPEL